MIDISTNSDSTIGNAFTKSFNIHFFFLSYDFHFISDFTSSS